MENKIRYYKQNGEEYSFSKEPQIKIMQTSNADMNIGIPKKQTAVEWLESELDFLSNYMADRDRIQLFEQAKEMEEKQIIDAYEYGNCDYEFGIYMEAEQYYKETYGK